MVRRHFLAAGLGAAASRAFAAAAPRYNVLFIAIDDLRPDIGCYGSQEVHTPHIDGLASRGLTFTRAYTQQAVCSPSRTAVLTGLRPDTTRVYDLEVHFRRNRPDAITLPQQFAGHGAVTSGFSKILHGTGSPPGGLDDARSWSIPSWYPGGPQWNTPENGELSRRHAANLERNNWSWPPGGRATVARRKRGPSWEAPDVPDEALADGKTAGVVIRALQTLRNQRFFLAAGFLKPHLPFVAPKKYFDLYPKEKIRLASNPFAPKGAPRFALHDSGELRNYGDIPDRGPISDEKAIELIRGYRAATSYTDAQIGRVLNELDRLGLRDNTVVMLWGDHGWHLGDHGLWCKHTNFENATRAPLIVRVPGQKTAGRKSGALVEFVDMYPTLCDLCAVPKPQALEGHSFAPLLDNPDRSWKKAAFSQYPRQAPGVGRVMGYSMRTDRYRFTEWAAPAKNFRAVELYDHERDPQENVNIAGDQPELVKRLTEQLHAGWRGALPR